MKILITERQLKTLNEIKNNLIDDMTYQKALEKSNAEFGDENGEWELDWYLGELERLQSKGGEVYRIVFLRSIESLKRKNLGQHWVTDVGVFARLYGSINNTEEYGNKKPYLIAATIPAGFIDIESSIHTYISLPTEGEVNLKGNPGKIKIKKYIHK